MDAAHVAAIKEALKAARVTVQVVAKTLGALPATNGATVEVDMSFATVRSVLYDAVVVPGGHESVMALKQLGEARHFVQEAFKHCKTIAACGEGVELLQASDIRGVRLSADPTIAADQGVVTCGAGADAKQFTRELIAAIAQHRHWEREKESVAA